MFFAVLIFILLLGVSVFLLLQKTSDIKPLLKKLGGQACPEKDDLICAKIKVPLDHFGFDRTRTIEVVFAVHPAVGERYGMFMQATPGGPGGEGIGSADFSYLPKSILEHYDIVYFDQRGLGLSNPLSCPQAYEKDFVGNLNADDTAGLEGFDTLQEQQILIKDTRAFVNECITEMGIASADFAYYGTDQVAEDIESFRKLISDDKMWLYGVSYGTIVSQTYAAAHGDHLAGLILDGTADLTATGEESFISQEQAINEVLLEVLKACNADVVCAQDFDGNAISAYDEFAERVSKKPIPYFYKLQSGGSDKREFTFNQLEYTMTAQLYAISTRTDFLHALAKARNGDMKLMADLYYASATLDTETLTYLGDETFADAAYIFVNCADWSFYNGTPEERVKKIIGKGQDSNGLIPRGEGQIYFGLYCAYWPQTSSQPVRAQPLVLKNVPVLVLNATLDPATPFHEGKAVAERLDNGYHVYVDGGVHAIYGWGNECPDKIVEDALIHNKFPAQREVVCKWNPAIIAPYEE